MNTDDFTIEYTPSSPRKTLRVTTTSLFARFDPKGPCYPLNDISASGISFTYKDISPAPCEVNEIRPLQILLANNKVLMQAKIKCLHVFPKFIGAVFVDLDRHTEAKLDKLVLEIQKQQIAKKNRKKQ